MGDSVIEIFDYKFGYGYMEMIESFAYLSFMNNVADFIFNDLIQYNGFLTEC